MNLVAYFSTQYAAALVMAMTSVLLPFIIRSPDYYNVKDKNEVASLVGDLSFAADVTQLAFHPFLGFLMDFKGRKLPTVVGFAITGLCLIGIPLPHEAKPWLYIFRLVIS